MGKHEKLLPKVLGGIVGFVMIACTSSTSLSQPAKTVMPLQQALPPTQGSVPPAKEQSFYAIEVWGDVLTHHLGWNYAHPRLLADVNGDGKQDVVGFGIDGVWLALSNGTAFTPALARLDTYNERTGWRVEKHERLTGDINRDRMDDIVAFGDTGVFRSLSTGSGFGPEIFVINDFGYNQGWRVDKHVRLLADVNGDGQKDIVAFGDAGVWLALSTSDGNFSAPAFVVGDLGYNQGWRRTKHIRTTADVDGDGKQDIVAFGDHGVWLALSTGTGFTAPQLVLSNFAYLAGSWKVDRHPRVFADVNRDGKQDIVGFGDAGVWIAYSTGNGFTEAQFVLPDFGYNQGWRVERHPRFVTDLNGDGYTDIVGYGEAVVYRALGGPDGFSGVRGVLHNFVPDVGYAVSSDDYPRFIADVRGNGLQDLVSFGETNVEVTRSSWQPPLPAPATPGNLRMTDSTSSSLTIAWDDSGNNIETFRLEVSGDGSSMTRRVPANTFNYTFNALTADRQYCFTVRAENLWDISPDTPKVCGRTTKQQPQQSNGPFTTSIGMQRGMTIAGWVPYSGAFGPIYDTGAIITNINFPTQWPPALLVKPNHSTMECSDPNAVILVHGDMTADQKMAIWGSATPSISGFVTLPFVGCSLAPSDQVIHILPVNITWTRP